MQCNAHCQMAFRLSWVENAHRFFCDEIIYSSNSGVTIRNVIFCKYVFFAAGSRKLATLFNAFSSLPASCKRGHTCRNLYRSSGDRGPQSNEEASGNSGGDGAHTGSISRGACVCLQQHLERSQVHSSLFLQCYCTSRSAMQKEDETFGSHVFYRLLSCSFFLLMIFCLRPYILTLSSPCWQWVCGPVRRCSLSTHLSKRCEDSDHFARDQAQNEQGCRENASTFFYSWMAANKHLPQGKYSLMKYFTTSQKKRHPRHICSKWTLKDSADDINDNVLRIDIFAPWHPGFYDRILTLIRLCWLKDVLHQTCNRCILAPERTVPLGAAVFLGASLGFFVFFCILIMNVMILLCSQTSAWSFSEACHWIFCCF